MNFYVIGIDYRAIQPEVRQTIGLRRSEIIEYCRTINLDQMSILFTCNRFEIYGIARDYLSVWQIANALRRKFPKLFSKAYEKFNNEMVRHTLRLACGLESPILGERQIVDQLNSWSEKYAFPLPLRLLWREVLAVAQEIRFRSGIEANKADIAEFVLSDLRERIGFQGQRKIAVIGTGKIAQLISEKRPSKTKLYFVSRKKHSRARRLARESNGWPVSYNDLSKIILSADAVISATASPHFILRKNHLTGIANRRNEILYLYDLAVPRDIDPYIGNIKNVFLQDIDDLDSFFRRHNESFRPYVLRAELLIEEMTGMIEEKVNEHTYQSGDAAELIGVEAG